MLFAPFCASGAHPDRVVSTADIGDAYSISKNHLVRVMHTLSDDGYLHLIPRRAGGVSLAKEPHLIRLGTSAQGGACVFLDHLERLYSRGSASRGNAGSDCENFRNHHRPRRQGGV